MYYIYKEAIIIQFSESLKGGWLAGIMSAIISGLLNHYLLPKPDSPWANTIGGFFTGFISAFIGVLIYIQTHRPIGSKVECGRREP